jgi:peptidoglycan/LPS O-acetylase OafA/YrhL
MMSRQPAPELNPAGSGSERVEVVEVLRGLAALAIATHHICVYGPISDHAMAIIPTLIDGVWYYGRIVVQIFFVISGFVTALSLSRTRLNIASFGRFCLRRYLRLALPYLATIALVISLTAISPPWFSTFPLIDDVSLGSLIAHAVFLQDILGYPSLSAGMWYLAIDFQFAVLFTFLLLWGTQLERSSVFRNTERQPWPLVGLLLVLFIASTFHWNLQPHYDVWVHYYLPPLLLGVLCGWAYTEKTPQWLFWCAIVIVGVGLIFQWRDRLVLAITTSLIIYAFANNARMRWLPGRRLFLALGRISYSLFLIHYPVLWVISGLGNRFCVGRPVAAVAWMGLALLASLAAAKLMYEFVEKPSVRLASRWR